MATRRRQKRTQGVERKTLQRKSSIKGWVEVGRKQGEIKPVS